MISITNLPHQLPGETVVAILRKDIFILLQKIILLLVMLFLPIIFFLVVLMTNAELILNNSFELLIVWGAGIYVLFLWLFFLFHFLDYYLDVWIITNERVIDIEQRGFFSRVISELKYPAVQDVTTEIHGIIPTLLKYGTVFVQTAGEKERFVFESVPEPDAIRDLLMKQVEDYKRCHH